MRKIIVEVEMPSEEFMAWVDEQCSTGKFSPSKKLLFLPLVAFVGSSRERLKEVTSAAERSLRECYDCSPTFYGDADIIAALRQLGAEVPEP